MLIATSRLVRLAIILTTATVAVINAPATVTHGMSADHNKSSSVVVRLSGSTNQQKVLNYWISQGLSRNQAAGITSGLLSDSYCSPLQQEIAVSWPGGGYGIAQFTFGQRAAVVKLLSKQLGKAVFTKYYAPAYAQSAKVPVKINDEFLQVELNYLRHYLALDVPTSATTTALRVQQGMYMPKGKTLLQDIKTLPTASATAKVWVYLYERPVNPVQVTTRDVAIAKNLATN